ncbi:MAG: SPFH domain-containing protein, partial [Propionibacteriaceae bacterium]
MLPTGLLDLTLGELLRGHPSVWLVCAGLIVALAVSAVRIVTEHDRVVVSRLGRTVRVAGPGLVWRLPVVERLTTVSLRLTEVPLVVATQTRDGVPVHLVGHAQVRIVDPALSLQGTPDPISAAVDALENQLSREVSHVDLAALLAIREQFELRLPGTVTALTAPWGLRVETLEISDIEAQVSAQLLRSTDHSRTGM